MDDGFCHVVQCDLLSIISSFASKRRYGLIVFGVVIGVLCSVYTDNYVSEMACIVPLGPGPPADLYDCIQLWCITQ